MKPQGGTQGGAVKGVQLSPLGFAACQSKNCTNRIESSVCAHLALLVHLRQVHPLKISITFKTEIL